jgi:hypothetical protein
LVTSTFKRLAMIDGQLCDWSEAPVPMVYESPRARYRLVVFTPLSLTLSPVARGEN